MAALTTMGRTHCRHRLPISQSTSSRTLSHVDVSAARRRRRRSQLLSVLSSRGWLFSRVNDDYYWKRRLQRVSWSLWKQRVSKCFRHWRACCSGILLISSVQWTDEVSAGWKWDMCWSCNISTYQKLVIEKLCLMGWSNVCENGNHVSIEYTNLSADVKS